MNYSNNHYNYPTRLQDSIILHGHTLTSLLTKYRFVIYDSMMDSLVTTNNINEFKAIKNGGGHVRLGGNIPHFYLVH